MKQIVRLNSKNELLQKIIKGSENNDSDRLAKSQIIIRKPDPKEKLAESELLKKMLNKINNIDQRIKDNK